MKMAKHFARRLMKIKDNINTDYVISGRYKFIPDIEVINLGHADSKGVVCLSGLNQDTFRGFLGCECQDFTTYADEEDGDISQDLSFGPYTILSEDKTEELMTVTTRYTYETTATATACINKDRNSAGCTVTNIANQKRNIMSKSSNGAVLITSITESIIPEDKDTITITFPIFNFPSIESRVFLTSSTLSAIEDNLSRVIFHFNLVIGDSPIPLWANGVGFGVAASLSYWMLKARSE